MYTWNEDIEKIIKWIEANLIENMTLNEMSKQIGYSPFYLSNKFHEITGMTIKTYIAGRRLSEATIELKNTDTPIVDIALKYGYSSQQSFTRAFAYAYNCTPLSYRKNPMPIPLRVRKEVLFPEYYYEKEVRKMNKTILTEPNVRMEFIPAHKYIHIKDMNAQNYFSFWENKNCDNTMGLIESMSNIAHPVVNIHTAGWIWEDEKRGYTYGIGVDKDFGGKIPDGFEIKEYPGSYYLVFYHPTFDFLKNCDEVVEKVEKMAWNFNPEDMGVKWNENYCQDYQRLIPETIGYEVLRPVIKIKQ